MPFTCRMVSGVKTSILARRLSDLTLFGCKSVNSDQLG